MGIWKQTHITINRGSWGDKKVFNEYLAFLKQELAPAIKELKHNGLIDCYHFVAHNTVDLRLSIKDGKENDVNAVLQNKIQKTFTDLEPYGESREDLLKCLEVVSDLNLKEVELKVQDGPQITDIGLEQVRQFHGELIHFLNLSIGMTNPDEIQFHINQALTWQYTLGFNAGVEYQKKAAEKVQTPTVRVQESPKG